MLWESSTCNVLYMPVATSIPNLVKSTTETLKDKHAFQNTLDEAGIQVSREMWVSIQFCAKNLTSTRDLLYTDKLNLVHKVQKRTLRATSVDSNYVAAAYKCMRNYGLWLSKLVISVNNNLSVIFASCDDKC